MSKSNSPKSASINLSIQDIEIIAVLVAETLNQNTLSQFLDERAAASFVGLTHRSLQTMRYDGTGPAFVKLGESCQA